MQIRGADRKPWRFNSVHRATLERRSFIVQGARARVRGKERAKMNSARATPLSGPNERDILNGFAIDNKAVQHSTVLRLICERCGTGILFTYQAYCDGYRLEKIAQFRPACYHRRCSFAPVPSTSDVATVRNAQTRASLLRPAFPIPSNFLPTTPHVRLLFPRESRYIRTIQPNWTNLFGFVLKTKMKMKI